MTPDPGHSAPVGDNAPESVLFRLERATLRAGARRLLPNTSWTLRAGQNWVILGGNGEGKTTLVGTLTGETPVVAGRRWFDRNRLAPAHVRCVSFEAHERLAAWDDGQDEARSFAHKGMRGVRVADILNTDRRDFTADPGDLDRWMDQTGLSAWREREIRTLSSGEMRQVMIARALLAGPRLLVIDEPFDGLDTRARRRLADMLATLMARGLQMVLITHHSDEILTGITHYMLLQGGRVAEQGVWRPAAPDRDSRHGVVVAPMAAGNAAETLRAQRRPAELVRMRSVTVVYEGRRVIDRLNWCVRPGEHWAVCGPNGAGKSTLLQLICGDHPQAYANDIHLFGRRRGRGETVWDIKRPIGLVSNALQIRYRKSLDGRAVMLSGFFDSVGLYRQASTAQVEAVRRWARRLSISRLLEKDFQRMSNGERRMVLIARAMVKEPSLLVLDEPCQGLDSRNRMRILEMLDMIVRTQPAQMIYVSHRPDELPGATTHELHLSLDGRQRIVAR